MPINTDEIAEHVLLGLLGRSRQLAAQLAACDAEQMHEERFEQALIDKLLESGSVSSLDWPELIRLGPTNLQEGRRYFDEAMATIKRNIENPIALPPVLQVLVVAHDEVFRAALVRLLETVDAEVRETLSGNRYSRFLVVPYGKEFESTSAVDQAHAIFTAACEQRVMAVVMHGLILERRPLSKGVSYSLAKLAVSPVSSEASQEGTEGLKERPHHFEVLVAHQDVLHHLTVDNNGIPYAKRSFSVQRTN